MSKQYLGDGVYVEHDGDRGGLVLTTENGISVTNSIFLEGEVWEALKRYVGRVETRLAEAAKAPAVSSSCVYCGTAKEDEEKYDCKGGRIHAFEGAG